MRRSLLERFLSNVFKRDICLTPDPPEKPYLPPGHLEKSAIIAAAEELETALNSLLLSFQTLEQKEYKDQRLIKLINEKYDIPEHLARSSDALVKLLAVLQPLFQTPPQADEPPPSPPLAHDQQGEVL